MRIDRRLNLVIPLIQDEGEIYIHSTPISREVFERYYQIISRAFTDIYIRGIGPAMLAGPRTAALDIKRIAKEMNLEDDVQSGLFNEIRRLSNVIAPSKDSGWQTYPLQEAINNKTISADDLAEVENAISFFTVASCLHRKQELKDFLDGAVSLWGAQTTLFNCTEYAASLTTSTGGASSGETPPVSSHPS